MVILARQITSNSIGSSSTELPLYDDYEDYYDDRINKATEFTSDTGNEKKGEQHFSSNNKPTSILLPGSTLTTVSKQNDINLDEDYIVLTAGLSQVYSKHNSNPNRDAKAMKLLLEKTGDETEVPMNCSQYQVSSSILFYG